MGIHCVRAGVLAIVMYGSLVIAQSAALTREESSSRLFLRIYGREAAGNIANSMGDVTEGLSWRQIEERYGLLDKLLPQDKSERRQPPWLAAWGWR